MNKRIKELAEQAITEKLTLCEFVDAVQKEPHDFYAFRISELEKFAELIVKECAMVVNDNDFEGSSVGDSLLFGRFGVE